MRHIRSFLVAAATFAAFAPASAQTIDSTQAGYQPTQNVQYWRPWDKRGQNIFETPKVAGTKYEGFKIQWGAAFTQQFQGLTHENTADSVFQAAVPVSPGNAGSAAVSNRNRLIEIGKGFNNATANLYMSAQLAPGVRVQLTSYLSARRHNETWVKDGFIQIDESPIDFDMLHTIMKYTTVKIGHFEVNYGDMHFRRSDNGQAMYNPFVGNSIMDAFTTEVGAEAIWQYNGFLAVGAITNGEIRGQLARPADRDPAHMVKIGYDKQLNPDLRVRLTGSYYKNDKSPSNTLLTGDRAGGPYDFVMENTAASLTAQAWSGQMRGMNFSNHIRAVSVNPFIKFRGLEFFGVIDDYKGKTTAEPTFRTWKQQSGELVYRFWDEKIFAGARMNTAKGRLSNQTIANSGGQVINYQGKDVSIDRNALSAGWFVTPTLLMKAEYMKQMHYRFPTNDIRYGGKIQGFMFEGVVSF